MIQLDSCAVMKLVRPEQETAALTGWLGEHRGTPLVASALARVEVMRALTRVEADRGDRSRAALLLSCLHLHPVADDVLELAAGIGGQHLRSLDALHLATALVQRSNPTLVTYDKRLAAAAEDEGIVVAMPL